MPRQVFRAYASMFSPKMNPKWRFTLAATFAVVFTLFITSHSSQSGDLARERLSSGWATFQQAAGIKAAAAEEQAEREKQKALHAEDFQSTGLNIQHKTDHGAIRQTSNPVDTFAKFRMRPECAVTTPQLHFDFEPKCKDKKSLLDAMAGGGRHGFDQPYASLGCDFKWFDTQDICRVLGKFNRIHVLGDSLMRQMVVAMHVLLREDLVDGGTWKDEGEQCSCRTLFAQNVRSNCFWYQAINTEQVKDGDPASIKCKEDIAVITLQFLSAYPLPEDAFPMSIFGLTEKHHEGDKDVYILGHGTWNQYEPNTTRGWIGQLEDHYAKDVPWFKTSPRLFISPHARGENSADDFMLSSNNIRVQRYVHEIDGFVTSKGYDHMRFYNLTVQSSFPDGTHASLESTLVEAMMVFNWLDVLEV